MPGRKKKVKQKIKLEEPLELVAGEEGPKDIYDEEGMEEQLEGDEITAAEEGFMRGREGDLEGGKKSKRATVHKDTTSVEMAKRQYGED